jgi:hypothetical protein
MEAADEILSTPPLGAAFDYEIERRNDENLLRPRHRLLEQFRFAIDAQHLGHFFRELRIIGVSRERRLQKNILVVDGSLENCHRFASNNDVVLSCVRVRSSNCAKKRAHGAAYLAEA